MPIFVNPAAAKTYRLFFSDADDTSYDDEIEEEDVDFVDDSEPTFTLLKVLLGGNPKYNHLIPTSTDDDAETETEFVPDTEPMDENGNHINIFDLMFGRPNRFANIFNVDDDGDDAETETEFVPDTEPINQLKSLEKFNESINELIRKHPDKAKELNAIIEKVLSIRGIGDFIGSGNPASKSVEKAILYIAKAVTAEVDEASTPNAATDPVYPEQKVETMESGESEPEV